MAKFTPVFVRSPNNYSMDEATLESAFACEVVESRPNGRTQQHFKEECDINTIVRNFGVTGELPTSIRPPMQGDFADAMDFRQSMDAIRAAQEAFAAMPSAVRTRFHNDPAEFVDFTSNPDNLAEMRKLGLAVPPPPEPVVPPPMAVRIVPDPIPEGDKGKA